jgi:hypothetical protein
MAKNIEQQGKNIEQQGKNIERQGQEIAAMRNDLADTKNELKGDIKEVKQQLSGVQQRLSGVQQQLDRQNGQYAFMRADGARLQIHLMHGTIIEASGCGVYVDMNGECFAATNAHVVRPAFVNNFKLEISLGNGEVLHQRSDFFFYEGDADAALIPVDCYNGPNATFHQALSVMSTLPVLGTEMFSISSGRGNRMAIHCEIKGDYSPGRVIANCGGTYGFSGTGLLDQNGVVVGVHVGTADGPALDEDGVPLSDEHAVPKGNLKQIWEWLVVACQPGWVEPTPQPTMTLAPGMTPPPTKVVTRTFAVDPDCFKGMRHAQTIGSLNPTLTLTPGVFLHQLLNAHRASGAVAIPFVP